MVRLIILTHLSYFIYLILFIQFECALENIKFHKEQEMLSWVAASDLSIAHVLVHKEHILGLTFNFLFVCTGNVIPHLINWNIVAHYKIPSKIIVPIRFATASECAYGNWRMFTYTGLGQVWPFAGHEWAWTLSSLWHQSFSEPISLHTCWTWSYSRPTQ